MMQDDFDETKQRINRINAEVGGLVLLPDQWGEVDAMTDAISRNGAREQWLDNNPAAVRLAAELMSHTRASWSEEREMPIDTHLFPNYDPAGPRQLFAITADSFPAIALEQRHHWVHLAHELEASGEWCDLRTSLCSRRIEESFAVSRGDYICVFACCNPCYGQMLTGRLDQGPFDHWMASPPAAPAPDDDIFGG